MYITIDLDLHERREEVGQEPRELTELELLTYLLRIAYVCRATKCRICRTRKGLHVYIKVKNYDFEKAIALRLLLGDDPIRAEIDIIRYRRGIVPFIETLFVAKVSKDGLSKEVCVDTSRFFEELVRRL